MIAKKETRQKIGFLASGHGSNMQALIDACETGEISADPCVVISNNHNSGALKRAKSKNIPAFCFNAKTHPDPELLDKQIRDTLKHHHADYVMLAGYIKKLGPNTIAGFPGRILNIHPALLPKHAGKGMYGIHVHEAVLAAGETETGVTIHIVDEHYDHGPIIAQSHVSVEEGDSPETLAARVLSSEHKLLVDTFAKIVRGDISLRSC